MADQRARTLRANATDAERRLWRELRTLKAKGLHFRRQAPLGPYYVDFVCHSAKLVIELDGSQHAEPAAKKYDEQRTAFLTSRGYAVLRFWNCDLLQNRESVLDTIFAWCEARSAESAIDVAPPSRGGRIRELPFKRG